MTPVALPRVIATSVVRSAHQGESHGGIYRVDLESGDSERVVDWNTTDIEWLGRGHDRGLRGIASWRGLTYVAASDALLAYDGDFRQVAGYRNRYLRHCHEIDRDGDVLWLTSTGFDALLAFDLERGTFREGICLRPGPLARLRHAMTADAVPPLRRFDPLGDRGPAAGDTLHVNSVIAREGALFCSGTGLGSLLRVTAQGCRRHARIPARSHNARPYRGGVLLQDTARDRVLHVDLDGTELESWPLPRYAEEDLEHRGLPADHARQAFGRGLCLAPDGCIVAGSSPSTISVYRHGSPEPVRSINLTLDVRNAIHGLELELHELG